MTGAPEFSPAQVSKRESVIHMEYVTKFFDAVYWFFMFFCKICFIGMITIIAIVVSNRYIFKTNLVWGEPIVLMFMVYMSLVSAALAIRKDTHIRMSVIDYFAPKKVISFCRGAAHVCIFGFGIFMVVYGWKFALQARRNIMTGTKLTSMWLYLACPMGGIALCLMELERFINFCYRVKHGLTLENVTLADESKAMAEDARQGSEAQAEFIKNRKGAE